jgi:hypothetical protein
MRLDKLFEDLKFQDAKRFIQDLEYQTGQISEIAESEPWLREISQKDIAAQHGNEISVFRALTLREKLRPETIVSTSLDIKTCTDILISSPDFSFRTSKTFRKIILHYRIPVNRVVIWVPSALEHVKKSYREAHEPSHRKSRWRNGSHRLYLDAI